MTTQPKDLMTLEETLFQLRQKLKNTNLSPEARELCESTIHHLEAGRKALELANDAMNTCMDHCLENGHVFSQSYDSTKIGTAHIAVRAVLCSLNQAAIHNEITSS